MNADIGLSNARGMRVRFAPLGAAISEIVVADRHGEFANVAMAGGGSAGKVIGRYANRIARGHLTLDGVTYALATNENGNTLHGGPDGFSKRTWELTQTAAGSVQFTLVSTAGDQGFPGTLTVHVTYSLGDDDALRVEYAATADAPTVVNLTNHVYFNLTGDLANPIDSHELEVHASSFVIVDTAMIPTGTLAPVAGTDLDFRTARPIGSVRSDATLVIDGTSDAMRAACRLSEATSGRSLVVETTEPAMQYFSGHPGAVALETQHFPDSPNHPEFPTTVLRPGETFRSTTVYRFSV